MTRRYYRIDKQPNLQLQSQKPLQDLKEFIKTTKNLIDNNKYFYIDMNNENVKVMSECSSQDEEDDVEKVSKKYTINLNDVNNQGNKAKLFLQKMREGDIKKDKAHTLIKQELRRSYQYQVEDKKYQQDKFIKQIKPQAYHYDELATSNIDKEMINRLYNPSTRFSRHQNNKSRTMSIDYQNLPNLISRRQFIDHLLPHRRSLVKTKQAIYMPNPSRLTSSIKLQSSKDKQHKQDIRKNCILPQLLKKNKMHLQLS